MFDDAFLRKRSDFHKKRDSRDKSNSIIQRMMDFSRYPSVYYDLKDNNYLVQIQVPVDKKDVNKGVTVSFFVCNGNQCIKSNEIPEWVIELQKDIQMKFEHFWSLRMLL